MAIVLTREFREMDWLYIEATLDQMISENKVSNDVEWFYDLIVREDINLENDFITNLMDLLESYRLILYTALLLEKYEIAGKIKTVVKMEIQAAERIIATDFKEEEKDDIMSDAKFIIKSHIMSVNNFVCNIYNNETNQ